ncbi:MAG: acyl-CoA synthetase, partial [Actinomycetota bacterium]|nr:acyl-CoA synthetase [Actinomycetota bacterium]
MSSVVERLARYASRTAVVDPGGTWTFDDLADARVALLCTAGHDFVAGLLACWMAGAVAVPLHPPHPDAELVYVIDDADVSALVTSAAHRAAGARLAAAANSELIVIEPTATGATSGVDTVSVDMHRPALMIHTSGTTGRPKGVVHTHGSVAAQVDALLEAWAWSADDRIMLVLPLNHIHGLVNVTLCALAAGACCEAPGGFDATHVWQRMASGELTLFMAVPTIYMRLIAAWEQVEAPTQSPWSAGAGTARLMVSGSAALPVSTLDRWREITGQVLLERYGMTELGMVLSNTLARRVPGHVGAPLPGVEVRVVDDAGRVVDDGQPGELRVRGPNVFAQYWRRPEATAEAFVDGWFRTGDVAVLEPGGYRLLGRSSVDIIKTGGEKVSALEIEEILRTHDAVADCAVVGVADAEWGERVCAAVILLPDAAETAGSLRAWG